MTQRAIRWWSRVHTWSSLVCTAFLLFLCVTGLPLIFHAEIDGWLVPDAPLPAVAPGTPLPTLDHLMDAALALHPGDVPLYLSFRGGRRMTLTTGPTPDAPPAAMHLQEIDRLTGRAIPATAVSPMDTVLALHTDLLLGEPAELLLGVMGLLFVTAVISGIVLYVPFTGRLPFGAVRREKSPRVRRLDRHNLIGIATLAWATIVGATGTINTLVGPITSAWKATELAEIGRMDGAGVAPVSPGAIQRAFDAASAAAPRQVAQFIAFPGVAFSTAQHITVYFQGGTPLTAKVLLPAFVSARTGRVDALARMPWYMQALLLAQPLHFGDYGGLVMKIAWALLDLFTIWVVVGGFRLWLTRGTGRR